jgi:alpha-galactosidase
MDVPAILEQDSVRFEIMRHFDYFVTESSHHMSEYVPWFRKSPESVVRSLPKRWDYYEICKSREGTHYGAIRRKADGEEPIPFDRTHEYCAEIIHSIETDTPRRINGNVSNDGLIANLPSGSCVEVPCLVDGAGVHPCAVGNLPPQLAAINRTNVNVQELAFHAHVTGDRRYVYQAIQLDPLTSALLSLSQIRTMVDEMFAAESDRLPQFR